MVFNILTWVLLVAVIVVVVRKKIFGTAGN
jgi:hypothetical protein